ncbi:MAG TPA: methyltransferase domain-containing protein, partial [bacterium]|nr:methyltransferase domain-containing protein [bacterium]
MTDAPAPTAPETPDAPVAEAAPADPTMGGQIPEDLVPTPLTDAEKAAIEDHLAKLGIQSFDFPGGPAKFLAYVQETLGDARCAQVDRLRTQRGNESAARYADDIAFYELFSDPDTARALQSTRYDYFRQTGPRVMRYLPDNGRYVDLGCNTGVLTTFYAAQRPAAQFLGVDRVPAPLKVARKDASALGLQNVKFDVADALRVIPGRNLDGVISTTAFWRKVEFAPRDLQRYEAADTPGKVALLQASPAMRFNATVVQQIQKALRPGG